MLDWDDLRYFLTVARTGSLSAAARSLGVTQPTVGRRMTAFEHELGADLVERTPTGQRLTATGQRLVALAEGMEQEALAAERIATGRDAGLRGKVTVTASEWLVDRVLSTLVAPLLERHPRLELELSADTRHLNLARREADIALRPSRFQQQDVVQRKVATLSFGLYASDTYLATRGMPDFRDAGEGHRLIAMSEALTRVPELPWLPLFAPELTIVARANGRLPMATLAAAGIGLTVLPHFVGDATPRLRFLKTPVPGPVRALFLGVHKDARSVPRIRATANFLAESMSVLQPALCPMKVVPDESCAPMKVVPR